MLKNESQLLERSFNTDVSPLAPHHNILLANFAPDGYCQQLAKRFGDKRFTAFSYNYADYQTVAGKCDNLSAVCDHRFEADEPFDCVVIYFPKSKPEFEFLINNLFNYVKPQAPIYVVGDNKGGVKSCEKFLLPFCTKPQKADAAKHCSLFLTSLVTPSKPFVLSDWYKKYQVNIGQTQLDVFSLPGVFSHGSLDDGTRLLLDSIKQPPGGKVMDFGCGAGLIGAYLGKLNPKVTLTSVDVSALAVESTKTTLAANGLEGTALLSDGLSNVSGKFNHIYSNPPFHTGVKTNYQITETFLQQAKQFLQPQGNLVVVANSFLKYQPILEQTFGRYEQVSSNKRFNVYHAQNASC